MVVEKSLGMRLVSTWLIAFGILVYLPVVVPLAGLAMAVLAIAAGIALLYEVRAADTELLRNLGTMLLALWLIGTGLLQVFIVTAIGLLQITSIFAVVAGMRMLFELRQTSLAGNMGKVSLGIWMIVPFVLPILGLDIRTGTAILGLLGFVTGVLILLGR